MITINGYSILELKKLNASAYKRALNYLAMMARESAYFEDLSLSLQYVFKCSGIDLIEWYYGDHNHKVIFCLNAEDLTGKRAFAWLENNLLSKLRLPYVGAERWEKSRLGKTYRAGMVPPCPLTGAYYDDVFIEELFKSIKQGKTLREAYENLSGVATRLYQDEMEYLQSEGYLLEMAQAHDYVFSETGREIL